MEMDGPAAAPRAIALAMFLCAIIPVTLFSAEPPFAAGRPAPIEVDQSRDEFCIVVVPDTQRLAATWRDAGMAFLLGETPIAPPAAAP